MGASPIRTEGGSPQTLRLRQRQVTRRRPSLPRVGSVGRVNCNSEQPCNRRGRRRGRPRTRTAGRARGSGIQGRDTKGAKGDTPGVSHGGANDSHLDRRGNAAPVAGFCPRSQLIRRTPMAQTYEEMDAIAMLKADHRRVEELFEKFEKATSPSKKQNLALQACLELKVHTALEEEIFYPACRGKIEDDLLNEAYVEHDGAKTLINEIEAMSAEDEFYDAK